MKSIDNIGAIIEPEGVFIKKYVCDGCYQEVEQKEMTIPVGPMKGTKTLINFGCKCADIELIRETKAKNGRLRKGKLEEVFNHYSLLNDSLQAATLENYEPTNEKLAKVKGKIEDYINGFDGKKSLMLFGGYGTGKSHLSVSITKKLMDKGKRCLFLSLPKLLTKIKDTYNNDGVTEDELLEMIKKVDLLVLDDLGAEHPTPWTVAKMFEVIDDRAGKSTVYTTNLSSKELRERFNERNFSRIMENTESIGLQGEDFRRKNKY